jgi:hypothetical protein
MVRDAYADFLARKTHVAEAGGFEPTWLPDAMKPFQRHLTDWNIRRGRAATFADCGLGKTFMQLVTAENIVRRTNRPYLLLTPLAVGPQTVREGERWGVECERVSAPPPRYSAKVYVTNYERLHHFDPADFGGAGCDESSCIKDMDSDRTAAVIEFFRTLAYRHLWTATAAPNDYTELGTSSEALGRLGLQDMLSRFFRKESAKDRLGWGRTKHVMRGHAERDFWRWVCSWARACRRPSDLGFDDTGYDLPELITDEYTVAARQTKPGYLIDPAALSLPEQREEQRRTIRERCEKVAEVLAHDRPAVAWCHLNAEGDLLAKLIPGAVQVSGKDSDERKEEVFAAFASGQITKLVTKGEIAGFGLNWQHCGDMTFFPSHSFERYYQCVRRCLRFGRVGAVRVGLVTTDGQAGVLANLQRKADAAEAMFGRLVELMRDGLDVRRMERFTNSIEVPSWVSSTLA